MRRLSLYLFDLVARGVLTPEEAASIAMEQRENERSWFSRLWAFMAAPFR